MDTGTATATAAAPVRPRPTLGRRLAGPQNRNLWFWLFVGPFVLGLLIFVFIPIVWSIYLSFFDARNTVTPTDFVGLANYRQMLTDPAFLSSLGTFIVFAIFIVPDHLRDLAGVGAGRQPDPLVQGRSSGRSTSCRRPAPTWWRR